MDVVVQLGRCRVADCLSRERHVQIVVRVLVGEFVHRDVHGLVHPHQKVQLAHVVFLDFAQRLERLGKLRVELRVFRLLDGRRRHRRGSVGRGSHVAERVRLRAMHVNGVVRLAVAVGRAVTSFGGRWRHARVRQSVIAQITARVELDLFAVALALRHQRVERTRGATTHREGCAALQTLEVLR